MWLSSASAVSARWRDGYSAEKAMTRGCWGLRDADGNLAKNAKGSTAFTVPELVAFLNRAPVKESH